MRLAPNYDESNIIVLIRLPDRSSTLRHLLCHRRPCATTLKGSFVSAARFVRPKRAQSEQQKRTKIMSTQRLRLEYRLQHGYVDKRDLRGRAGADS
jgi:hypothetical protein